MNWEKSGEYADVICEKAEGIAKIALNRPDKKNAYRARTATELQMAFMDAWHDPNIAVVILTGSGNSFCSGGDVSTRDPEAGKYEGTQWTSIGGIVNYIIRSIPKPVIAMVNGYAIGGGQVMQTVCDLAIASDKAVFGQVGPRFGSFNIGYGIEYLARLVGERKAREMWFLCRRYTPQQALEMGLINAVVPHDKLEQETVAWCKEIMKCSPTAIKALKYALNCESDHLEGNARMGSALVKMFYSSDEGQEGSKAFLEKREPNYVQYCKNL